MREITRVTLFVPGRPPSLAEWANALRAGSQGAQAWALSGERLSGQASEHAAQVEWIANDGAFGTAFSFGNVPDDELGPIDRAPGALVLRWPVDLLDGRLAIVSAVRALQRAGGLAVRVEQSKLGWGIGRWLELFAADDPWAWHRGAVVFLRGDGALQSCGMHAFSRPDAWVALADTPSDEPDQLQHLGSILNVYQLAEDPVLRSGETFSAEAGAPRRRLERWPDLGYPEGDSCHNPYGVWRLGAPGGTARPLPELEPMPTLSLLVMLQAVQAKQDAPLTAAQVASLRDQNPCIALQPRDALMMERARGYADLNPELVWEQWRALRGSRE